MRASCGRNGEHDGLPVRISDSRYPMVALHAADCKGMQALTEAGRYAGAALTTAGYS